MTAPRDRIVHAVLPDGVLLVRYDRSGKWYLEPPANSNRPRQHLTLSGAVQAALVADVVHLGRPGGQQFSAAYRRATAARDASL